MKTLHRAAFFFSLIINLQSTWELEHVKITDVDHQLYLDLYRSYVCLLDLTYKIKCFCLVRQSGTSICLKYYSTFACLYGIMFRYFLYLSTIYNKWLKRTLRNENYRYRLMYHTIYNTVRGEYMCHARRRWCQCQSKGTQQWAANCHFPIWEFVQQWTNKQTREVHHHIQSAHDNGRTSCTNVKILQ